MNDEPDLTKYDRYGSPQRAERPPLPRGPAACVYVVLKVIGCRLHYLAVSGGWTSRIDHWTVSWTSSEREVAYQRAKSAGGLLVRWTQAEWATLLDAAISQDNEEHGQGSVTQQ